MVGNKDFTGLNNPDVNNAIEGCTVDNPCKNNPCSNGASCVDEWEQYSCQCPLGKQQSWINFMKGRKSLQFHCEGDLTSNEKRFS